MQERLPLISTAAHSKHTNGVPLSGVRSAQQTSCVGVCLCSHKTWATRLVMAKMDDRTALPRLWHASPNMLRVCAAVLRVYEWSRSRCWIFPRADPACPMVPVMSKIKAHKQQCLHCNTQHCVCSTQRHDGACCSFYKQQAGRHTGEQPAGTLPMAGCKVSSRLARCTWPSAGGSTGQVASKLRMAAAGRCAHTSASGTTMATSWGRKLSPYTNTCATSGLLQKRVGGGEGQVEESGRDTAEEGIAAGRGMRRDL